MSSTKDIIIAAAIKCFNAEGIDSTRNQDVAEAAGMGLSNFNYHFKTKAELVVAVCTLMAEIVHQKVYGKNLMEANYGLHIMKRYFEFQQKYRFFYLDTPIILKRFPELVEGFKIQNKKSIEIIKNINFQRIGMGHLIPEPETKPGLYDKLAEQIWFNNHFWLASHNFTEPKENFVQSGLETYYYTLYPYLTEKGITAYKKTFIEEFNITIN